MMKRTAHMLLAVLLCLAGWQTTAYCSTASTAASAVHGETATIGSTNVHIPQWQDLGMENLLVAAQSTVTAPTPVRLAHDNVSALGRIVSTQHRFHLPASEHDALPHRAQPGYIYQLLRLRL